MEGKAVLTKLEYETPQIEITMFEIERRIMNGADVVGLLNDNEDGNRETTAFFGSIGDPGDL